MSDSVYQSHAGQLVLSIAAGIGDISEKSTIDKIPNMFFQSLAHIFFCPAARVTLELVKGVEGLLP